MADAKHIEGELDCFFGNANGRGLTRIEVMGIGHHVASMPRGPISEATALEICRRWNAHADLLAELQRMSRAYVSLMEAGRDRIVMLGGDCDPVDKMEGDDPNLRSARAAIAKATAA